MQNAKDTFYEVLRDRLAARFPERTVVVRGVTRPAVLVAENELAEAAQLTDCFALHWGSPACQNDGGLRQVMQECTITYATAGSAGGGGLDRGRALAAMDAALLAIVSAAPQNAPERTFANAPEAVATGTRIWWSDATFRNAEQVRTGLGRSACVQVMSVHTGGAL